MSDAVKNGDGQPEDPEITRQHRPSHEPETQKWAGARAASSRVPTTRPNFPDRSAPAPGVEAAPTRQHVAPGSPETKQNLPPSGSGPRGPRTAEADPDRSRDYIPVNLPPNLAREFTAVRVIASGGQAWVLLGERQEVPHDRVAIKLYNHRTPGDAADPRPDLSTLPEDVAVQYVEPKFGSWNDQWWEVHEYLEHGNIRELAEGQEGRLTSDQLTELITWGAHALEHLHHRTPRVIHRDLKPTNILVRSLDPPRYALADFGLAILTESTHTKRSDSRTEAYAPPEAVSGTVGPARDWWGLGMTIAELAVGRHPYQATDGRWLADSTILNALMTKPVPLDHVEDERLLHLMRGLLTKDPDTRWNHAQVRAWLDGETPALGREWANIGAEPAAESVSQQSHREFEFLGRTFDDPALLGRYIGEHWQAVANALAGRSGGRELDHLVGWIDEVAPGHSIRGSVDSFRTGRSDPVAGSLQLLLAKIVVRLDPEGEPTFMGEQVDLRSLSGWAARIGRGAAGSLQKVSEELYRTGALRVYAQLDGYESLGAVQRHWEAMADQSYRYFTAVPAAGKVTPGMWAVMLRLAVARVIEEAADGAEEGAVAG